MIYRLKLYAEKITFMLGVSIMSFGAYIDVASTSGLACLIFGLGVLVTPLIEPFKG